MEIHFKQVNNFTQIYPRCDLNKRIQDYPNQCFEYKKSYLCESTLKFIKKSKNYSAFLQKNQNITLFLAKYSDYLETQS